MDNRDIVKIVFNDYFNKPIQSISTPTQRLSLISYNVSSSRNNLDNAYDDSNWLDTVD
jgi:hypothetical protein